MGLWYCVTYFDILAVYSEIWRGHVTPKSEGATIQALIWQWGAYALDTTLNQSLSVRGDADVGYGLFQAVLGIGSLNKVVKSATLPLRRGKPVHRKKNHSMGCQHRCQCHDIVDYSPIKVGSA